MKHLKNLLATVALLIGTISASAHDFVVDGIYYNITSETDLTVSVTYQGESSNSYDEYSGEVIIPSTVNFNGETYSVTSIEDSSFRRCDLTSVTIPNSVTSIGDDAFSWCEFLTSVIFRGIPKKGVEIAIGARAFYSCGELTSINIPRNVTSIGDDAFNDCFYLTSVTIPNSVTSIGSKAFESCYYLTSITIPNSVTSIGSDAFYGTGWYYNQPDGILYLDNCCLGYKGEEPTGDISIKPGTRVIAGSAFYDCTGLTSVTIPEGVTSIEYNTFAYCYYLTSVTIPESVVSIGPDAFCRCTRLTYINIPNSVTSIGSDAFRGCTNLTSINIPNSVTSIGEGAFIGCTGLTSVTIPNSVTSIGNHAFQNCTGLTSITIKEGVTSIGEGAFSLCTGLTSINIPNSVTSIGRSAFWYCTGLTSVTIPEGVTSIGYGAFHNCTGLTSITIPNSVTSISSGAFDDTGWYNNQPDGILYLDNCCLGYKGVKPTGDISIKPGTRVIAGSAFYNCHDLTSVTIPEGVTSIENAAFDCRNLKTIVLLNTTPPELGRDNFPATDAVVYVPQEAYSSYCNDSNWSKYTLYGYTPVKASSIVLNQTSATIAPGKSLILSYEVLPANTTDKGVTWSSGNKKVATVTDNGDGTVTVTAVADGTTTITATATDGSDVTATCEVTVCTPVSELSLSHTTATLNVGNTLNISYTALPANATDKSVAWTSSDEDVATVSANSDGTATVTAIADGTTTITATATDGSDVTATCEVTVTAPSAIDGAESDAVSVIGANGVIVVKDAPIDSVVNVYTPAGVIVASQAVTEDVTHIKGLTPGLYIVTIAGKSYKVVL